MRYILTLALSVCIAFSALAENKIRIGSLPLKSCSVLLVEEYYSKARLGQKVMVVSDYGDVYSFREGKVTKVLNIDNNYSVFVKSGEQYFVYNELKEVGVTEGDRLDKGDFIGELKYNSRYNEHQMEMQVWRDNGNRTCRLNNNEVVCILSGTRYVAPRKVAPARHKSGRHSKVIAKHGRGSKHSRAVASRSKSSKHKAVAKKALKSKKAGATKKKGTVKKSGSKKKRR